MGSILTPDYSCDLTPPICGTQQNWNSVWQEGPYDNHTIGAAALRAPAASKEASRPQAILKFQPRNIFDHYRVR